MFGCAARLYNIYMKYGIKYMVYLFGIEYKLGVNVHKYREYIYERTQKS